MSRLIGILGGTFDPVHYGHLRPTLEILQGLGLDEIRLIPAREPPHRDPPQASARQRLRMVQLAASGQPGFVVDGRELQREGPSYTLETLRSLYAEKGNSSRFCLLLGIDAFYGFPFWHEPEEILRLAHLIVMHRPGAGDPETADLETLLRRRRTTEPDRLRDARAGSILFYPVTQLHISATAIRSMIARGESPRYLLPDAVLGFIEQEGLYKQ